jgi:hypothetical protein
MNKNIEKMKNFIIDYFPFIPSLVTSDKVFERIIRCFS